MRWIGQHIWDFISRFRGKVYLENVDTDNSVTEVIVIDPSTNELKKNTNFTGGSGGGSVTVKATEASGGEAFSNINTIQVYDATGNGTGIQAYDNGTGKVLISVPPADFSNPFNISRATSFESGLTIAESVDATGKKFYAGDWDGASNKVATIATEILYDTYTQKGNMENNSKIEVKIYGPEDSTSSGAGNEIGTATHTVTGNTSNETFNADGVKIKILNFADDVVPNKNKARVQVVFSPAHIPDALIISNSNFSGSQKYYSVNIKHTNNDGTLTYGNEFNDVEFFYDGAQISPGNPVNFNVSLDNSPTPSTMYLSNIKYYNSANFTVSGEDVTNLFRDTSDSINVRTTITPSGVSTGDNTRNTTIVDHDGTTNDDDNSFSTSYSLGSNIYYLSQAVGATATIFGGLAADNENNTATPDTARAYNTFVGGISNGDTDFSDSFFSETRRLPHHSESSWNVTNITQAQLETYAGVDNLENDGRDLLVQTQHSGSVFKLVHPSDISTPASSPVQDRWNNHTTPAGTDFAIYYRYFVLPLFGGSLKFKMTGITRSYYTTAYNNDLIKVAFSRPTSEVGNNNSWVPLNPNINYDSNGPNRSCYWGEQPSNPEEFNIQFNTNPKNVVVRIEMKSGFTTASTVMKGISLTNQ